MRFSIIIPVKEINDYIRESVPITLELDHNNFEILILPNELPPEAEPFLPVLSFLKDPRIRLIPTGRVSPAVKRDIGAKECTGEILAFLDDDAYPRKDWLQEAEKAFSEMDIAALGGPAITPETNSIGQKTSGLFFETIVGGGGMSYRYKPAS